MKDWFSEALIYQINPRSLAAREPRLDRLGQRR